MIKAKKKILSLNSRGLMYGDGCFETLRIYNGHTLFLAEHLDRLKASMQYLDMTGVEIIREDICREWLCDLIKKNDIKNHEAWVRIQVWREGKRGFATTGDEKICWAIQCGTLENMLTDNNPVLTVSDIHRIPSSSLDSRFKLSNSINYIKAASEAGKAGADDALMLTISGDISETTKANIFWIREGIFYTPSDQCDLLPGITRSFIINIIQEEGWRLKIDRFKLEDIQSADAVFICNSIREIQVVDRIGNRTYECRLPLLQKLKKKFIPERQQLIEPLNK